MPPAKSPLEEIEEKIKNEKQLSSIPVEKAAPLQDVASPVSTPTEEEKTDVLKEVDTEPKTDIAGLTGAIARPLSNLGAQMAVGGMIGSVLGGGINPATATIGAGAAPIIFGVEDLTKLGVNYLTGKSWKTGSERISEYLGEKLTELGVEEADTAAEKIIGATTEGLFAGGGPAIALKAGGKALKTLPKVKKTAEFLGEQPLLQTATGGAAALASTGAEEAGLGGPIPALAGLATGFAVPAAAKVKGAIAPSEARKTLEAEERVRFVYQSAFKDEKAREEAIQSLRKSGNISDDDVKLMIGDITNNKTMLAFQQALEKSNQEVAQRSFENLQGVGKKISRGMAEVGAPVEDTKTFFLNRYNELKDSYKQTIQDLDVQGLKVTQELEDAKIKLDDAEKNLAAGKIDAEQAYKEFKQTLDDAFDSEKSKRIETQKLDTNKSVADVIQKQDKFANDYATSLYKNISDVDPFQQPNTKKVIDEIISTTPEGVGGRKDIATIIQDINANISDKTGSLKSKELWELLDWRSKLNDEITQAMRSGKNKLARKLLRVKNEGIDADLEKLGEVNPQVKEANQFYAEYKSIFDTGAAEKAFKEGESLTQILDTYSKSEDDLIRLRKSIEGDPRVTVTPQQLQDAGVASVDALKEKGFNEVDNWIVDSVVDYLKKPQAKGFSTSKSIEQWKNGPGSVIFRAFKGTPSKAEELVDSKIFEFRNLEESANSAKNASDELAKKKISQGTPEKDAFDEARNTKKEIDRLLTIKRKQVIDEFQEFENTSLNPANRFIEGNASEVVGNIMSNAETSESQMKRILDAAAKDPTGKATQGVLNAGRKWLNSQVRSTSLATTTEGLPDPVLLVDSLQADLGKMQALLAEGSPQRKTLELLYGKNSRELAALDKSRQIFDAMARKTTLSPNEILKKDVTKGDVADTLMSIGAIGFANVKGYVAWKSIDLIRKLNQRAKGDVDKIYADLLARSLTDPVIAENMIRPINQQTWPQTKRFLRNMGIQARATDFGLEEDEDEGGEEKVKEEEFQAF
jgi:hypothetical protein